MRRSYTRRGVAGLLTAGVFGLVLLALGPTQPGGNSQPPPARKPRPERKPIAMPANPVGLEVHLGLKDTEPSPWGGEVELSAGKLLTMSVRRGGANAHVDGTRFTARSVRQQQAINGPILRLDLDAPVNTTVTLKTRQGNLSFKLADLQPGTRKPYLEGRATVVREEGAVRLTGRETEDDYPALAKGPDGTIWLAYVEYLPDAAHRHGPRQGRRFRGADANGERRPDRTDALRRQDLAPAARRDRTPAWTFGGRRWPWTARASSGSPGRSRWTATGRSSTAATLPPKMAARGGGPRSPGSRAAPAPTSTSSPPPTRPAPSGSPGKAWRDGQLRHHARRPGRRPPVAGAARPSPRARPTTGAPPSPPTARATSTSPGTPTTRATTTSCSPSSTRRRRIIPVADVARSSRPGRTWPATPHGRVWIAYEEGDEQWGKDYAHAGSVKNVGLEKNPGFAALRQPDGAREVPGGRQADSSRPATWRRRCTAEPAAATRACRGWRSMPPAASGCCCGTTRCPAPRGEVWAQLRPPLRRPELVEPRGALADSTNLMDNRPGLVPFGQGVLAVYSGDDRIAHPEPRPGRPVRRACSSRDRGRRRRSLVAAPRPPRRRR